MNENSTDVHHMSRKSLKRQLNGDKSDTVTKKIKKSKTKDDVVKKLPSWMSVDPSSKSPKFINKKKKKLVQEVVNYVDIDEDNNDNDNALEQDIIPNNNEDITKDYIEENINDVEESSQEINSTDVKKSKKKKKILNEDDIIQIKNNEEIISKAKKSKKNKHNLDDVKINLNNEDEITIEKPKKQKKNKKKIDNIDNIDEKTIKSPQKKNKIDNIVEEKIESPLKKKKIDQFDVPADIESLMEKKMKKKSKKSIQIVAQSPSLKNNSENVKLIKDIGRKSFSLSSQNTDESDADEIVNNKEPIVDKITVESQKNDKKEKKNKLIDQSLNIVEESKDKQKKIIENNLTTKTPDKKIKKPRELPIIKKIEKNINIVKIKNVDNNNDDDDNEDEIAKNKALLEAKLKLHEESKKIKNTSTDKNIKSSSPNKTSINNDKLKDSKPKKNSKKIISPNSKKALIEINEIKKKNIDEAIDRVIAQSKALLTDELKAKTLEKSKINNKDDDDDDDDDSNQNENGTEIILPNDSDEESESKESSISDLEVDDDNDADADEEKSSTKNQQNNSPKKDIFSDSEDEVKPEIIKKSPVKNMNRTNIKTTPQIKDQVKNIKKKTPKINSSVSKQVEKDNEDDDDDKEEDKVEVDINKNDLKKIKKELFNKKPKSPKTKKTFVDKSTQTIESSFKPKKTIKKTDDDGETVVKKIKLDKKNNDEIVTDVQKIVLSDEDLEKLKNIKIKLIHKPPNQHLIENNPASHQASASEREEFEKLVKIKKGFYNHEEDQLIIKNWSDFCQLHDWDEKNAEPFINLRHGKGYYIPDAEQRKKFYRFIGNGLDNRPLSSIFTRFSNLYNNKKTHRFTVIDDDYINKYLLEHPDDSKQKIFAHLTVKLNRPRDAIARRIRIIQARGDQQKVNDKINTSSAIKEVAKESSDEQNEMSEEKNESSEEQNVSSDEQNASSDEQNESD